MSSAAGKAKILIVDDQVENLRALGRVLAGLEQEIVRARSGEEALRLLAVEDYAAVLLDVRMPGMDGFETAGRIRSEPRTRRVPILFVTAFDACPEQLDRAYRIGAADFLLKPIRAEILRSKVRVFVNLHLRSRSLEREVARRRRAEESLRAGNRELEAFSYSVSHDLRGPLRAITGFSDILLRDAADGLSEEARDHLRRISAGARHMDALIQDLLAFSRLRREKIDVSTVDLGEVVTEAVGHLNGISADILREDPLPHVKGNRTLLAQVVGNLVSNAVKFVPAGARPRVRIRAERSGARARVWVEDNGIGIAPEHHERIFRVFERLHPGGVYPGTGIGLAIVRCAMERLGGACGLDSQEGAGSRFWIELPLAGSARRAGSSFPSPRGGMPDRS